MNKKRLVVLVLASNNNVLYNSFRNIYTKYLDKCADIQVYLIYGKDHITFTPKSHDLIFDTVPENYFPGMVLKTISAMEFVTNNIEYDYLLRTNLSTFWDFYTLKNRLDTLPKTKCFTGTERAYFLNGIRCPSFISGTNLILSRDIVEEVILHKKLLTKWNLPEDFALSTLINECLGIKHKPSIPGSIHFMEKFQSVDEPEILKEIELAKAAKHDNFRIKSRKNREVVDIGIANILLKHYYGETAL